MLMYRHAHSMRMSTRTLEPREISPLSKCCCHQAANYPCKIAEQKYSTKQPPHSRSNFMKLETPHSRYAPASRFARVAMSRSLCPAALPAGFGSGLPGEGSPCLGSPRSPSETPAGFASVLPGEALHFTWQGQTCICEEIKHFENFDNSRDCTLSPIERSRFGIPCSARGLDPQLLEQVYEPRFEERRALRLKKFKHLLFNPGLEERQVAVRPAQA